MCSPLRIAAVAILTFAVALACHSQPADPLPIERVVLFSSGVGYIQHSGQITGDGAITLHFTDEQLDDVLKSLIVEDRAGGFVQVATFPSRAASGTNPRFRLDGSRSGLTGLLAQLVGAEIIIERPNRVYRGRLIGSERVASGDNEQLFVSILTERGIEPVPFEGVAMIRALDPQLQAEIERALAEVGASYTAPGGDPLEVRFRGDGTRRASLGYVVRQPLWKTTYRLSLPSGDGRASLQGWAIVENHTDRDWSGISLSLVSGRPISFITRLSRPVFVDRPVLDVRSQASSPAPVRYGAGVPAGTIVGRVMDRRTGDPLPGAAVSVEGTNRGTVAGRDGSFELHSVPPGRHQLRASLVGYESQTASVDLSRGGASVDFRLDAGVAMESIVVRGAGRVRAPAAAEAYTMDIDMDLSVQAVAQAGQVGEVFEYSIADAHVPRGQAAMLPIVTGRVDVERVSLYQARQRERNPLRGFRLRNQTGQHLQAGPATVFDDGVYAGDVYLPDLTLGAEQFLSYAADLDLVVTEDIAGAVDSRLITARIENGVLITSHRRTTTSTYTVENRGERRRMLVVEHPKRAATLASPRADELTPEGYRFSLAVPAGRTETLSVREEDSIEERMQILDAQAEQLAVMARGERIPASVRRALERVADLQRAYAASRAERAGAERTLEELRTEQSRARENIQALPPDAPFVRQQIRRVEELETEIEATRAHIATLRAQEQEHRRRLETEVRSLTVG